jgi:hypothetical protein
LVRSRTWYREDSTAALGDCVWSGRASDVPGGHRRARRRGKVGPSVLPRMDARRLVVRRPQDGKGRRASRHASAAAAAPSTALVHTPGRARAFRTIAASPGGTALLDTGRRTTGPGLRPPRVPAGSRLWPGPERPPPAPPCCRGYGGDQMAALERAQRDVQRPRSELELGRKLRGSDGARVASRDHIEHRLLARGELIGGIAGQRSP